MNANPKEINVLDLLPQRLPFIMIDKLTHVDSFFAKTVFKIREDNLFCNDGVMEETGLIENIAQTCAASIGYKQLLENNGIQIPEVIDDAVFEQEINAAPDKIRIGVIAIINSLEMKRRPLVGEVLETSMTIEEEYFSTTVVRSEVQIGDEFIASSRMKLFITDKTPD